MGGTGEEKRLDTAGKGCGWNYGAKTWMEKMLFLRVKGDPRPPLPPQKTDAKSTCGPPYDWLTVLAMPAHSDLQRCPPNSGGASCDSQMSYGRSGLGGLQSTFLESPPLRHFWETTSGWLLTTPPHCLTLLICIHYQRVRFWNKKQTKKKSCAKITLLILYLLNSEFREKRTNETETTDPPRDCSPCRRERTEKISM